MQWLRSVSNRPPAVYSRPRLALCWVKIQVRAGRTADCGGLLQRLNGSKIYAVLWKQHNFSVLILYQSGIFASRVAPPGFWGNISGALSSFNFLLSIYMYDGKPRAVHDAQRTSNCRVDPTGLIAECAATKSRKEHSVRSARPGTVQHGGE